MVSQIASAERDGWYSSHKRTFPLLLDCQQVSVSGRKFDHLHAKYSPQLFLGPGKHLLELPTMDAKDPLLDAISTNRCSGVFASEGVSHQFLDQLACLISLDAVHVYVGISIAVGALVDVFILVGIDRLEVSLLVRSRSSIKIGNVPCRIPHTCRRWSCVGGMFSGQSSRCEYLKR